MLHAYNYRFVSHVEGIGDKINGLCCQEEGRAGELIFSPHKRLRRRTA